MENNQNKKTLITVIVVIASIILALAIILSVILLGTRDNGKGDGITSDPTQSGSGNSENKGDDSAGYGDGKDLPTVEIEWGT